MQSAHDRARNPWLAPVVALGLALAAGCAGAPVKVAERAAQEPERFEFSRPSMGTTFRLVFYAPDRPTAERAAERSFARIEALEAAMSDWRDDSEVRRLGALAEDGPSGPRPISAELFEVLARAREISAASGGAFDVTVGPCVRLWRRSVRQSALPSPERLDAARSAVDWRRLELDPAGPSANLGLAGMQIDLGGIAKGYALDRALAELASCGFERALVDGGGDVVVGAPPPGRSAWLVSVEGLRGEGEPAMLELAHAAVASSGDTYRFVVIDGVRYSHLIDPRTGLGLTRPIGATVVAPDGVTADGWSSAACVLGPERALELLERDPALEARIAVLEDGVERVSRTSGFAGMIAPGPRPRPPPASPAR